ncbi:MAG: hypothetical protein L7U45_01845 [Alphaproteobacteria bacterium]|nr:hypothetical protein [Alphaproteobacteria bacterium]
MGKLIEKLLKMMPVWFGIGFLGPVFAELYLRTSLQSLFPLQATSVQIYAACMIFGGLYGLLAWRIGRWI